MMSIEEARRIVLDRVSPLQPEEVPLVTADDAYVPRDIPAAGSSAMDGYAFSFAALRGEVPRTNGFLPAGGVTSEAAAAGEAVRIMTGAPIPPGCDTVFPVEEVDECPDGIRLRKVPMSGSNVRPRGEDALVGDLVIPSGSIGLITPLSCRFCSDCNRIRVTAAGLAASCLFSREGIDLMPHLRPPDAQAVRDALVRLAGSKPESHEPSMWGPVAAGFPMSRLGG